MLYLRFIHLGNFPDSLTSVFFYWRFKTIPACIATKFTYFKYVYFMIHFHTTDHRGPPAQIRAGPGMATVARETA